MFTEDKVTSQRVAYPASLETKQLLMPVCRLCTHFCAQIFGGFKTMNYLCIQEPNTFRYDSTNS